MLIDWGSQVPPLFTIGEKHLDILDRLPVRTIALSGLIPPAGSTALTGRKCWPTLPGADTGHRSMSNPTPVLCFPGMQLDIVLYICNN
jgi:hypothetical protein